MQQAQAAEIQAKQELDRQTELYENNVNDLRDLQNAQDSHAAAQAYVAAGEQVLALVDSNSFWIAAYFKETQLHHVKEGAMAKITFIGRENQPFDGLIESIAWGIYKPDGATVQLLPDVSQTVDWVRLPNRFPVRVRATRPPAHTMAYRPDRLHSHHGRKSRPDRNGTCRSTLQIGLAPRGGLIEELRGFVRFQPAPFAQCELVEAQAADPNANQPNQRMPDGRRHSSDLAVATFADAQLDPKVLHRFADSHGRNSGGNARLGLQQKHRGGKSPSAFEKNAFAEILERGGIGKPLHKREVGFFNVPPRGKQALIPSGLVGEE